MRGAVPAFAVGVVALAACASVVPKVELDRCNLGIADGNEAYAVRQGAACSQVARRLVADDQRAAAIGYARKACDLQHARGSEDYLALVRGEGSPSVEQLQRARATGEKACAGMVVAPGGGPDPRPTLCARTAELYEDLEPRSRSDAGRLYARACTLGDDHSCGRARSLGVDPDEHAAAVAPKSSPTPARPQPLPPPPPGPPPVTAAPPPPVPACHEMRPCVSLDVQQRNTSEVVGSIDNHCDRAVACTWCPAHAGQVNKTSCHSATLSPGEKRAGRDAGLWYDGFDAIAYDCMDASDPKGCLAL